jgi:hypothetical protein
MLTGEPGMDAKELAGWRRFYRRHPFGLARGDLQAWLVARNVSEVFGRGLRSPERALLGMARHQGIKKGAVPKSRVTSDALRALSAELGVPFTEGAAK